MTERGMLFSAPMVRALLDGSKTQTRRVLKRQPYVSRSMPPNVSDAEPGDLFVCPDMFPTSDVRGSVIAECERIGVYHCMGQRAFAEKHSPYGQPGDRLWVRETTHRRPMLNLLTGEPLAPEYDGGAYTVDGVDVLTPDGFDFAWWYSRRCCPSIHMPRWASRILLEITGVRVERLQDIREADARAEGVTIEDRHMGGYCAGEFLPPSIRAYRELWESINGAGSWNANPWVLVVEFRRIES